MGSTRTIIGEAVHHNTTYKIHDGSSPTTTKSHDFWIVGIEGAHAEVSVRQRIGAERVPTRWVILGQEDGGENTYA